MLQFWRFDISSVGRSETVAGTLSMPKVMLSLLKYQCTRIIHPLPSFPVGSHVVLYRVLGHTGLPLAANATHPPIKHNPPNGVTGPRNLNRCGSKTSKYIDPENIVIPAVKRPMASVFCGHATDAKVRMVECMSCWKRPSQQCFPQEAMISREDDDQLRNKSCKRIALERSQNERE
jgi:hypothetical protein